MDPQLIQAITQAVIQQLQQANVAPVTTPSLISKVTAQVVQQPTISQEPDELTPALQSNLSRFSSGASSASLSRSSSGVSSSASLSRSSSGVSVVSASSFKSARTLNFEEIEKTVRKKRRRRRCDPEKNAIVDALTRPLMEEFDTTLLAPLDSPLFKRHLKKSRNPNGTRSLRKNKTMVMKMFRKLVRPVIRRVLGRLDTPNAAQIYSKYYAVAIKIITKRRANHIQSWRIYGEPEKPVYDTPAQHCREPQPQKQRDCEPEPQHEEVDNDEETDPEPEPQPQRQRNHDPQLQQNCEPQPQRQRDREPQPQQQRDREPQSQQQRDREAQPQQQRDREAQPRDEPEPQHDVSDFKQISDDGETSGVFQCTDCKCFYPGDESHPKSGDVWRINVALRCKECYKKYMRINVVPIVADIGVAKDNLTKALTSPKKRKRRQATSQQSRKKSKTASAACKWCGATSHKTKRSKSCPFFGTTLTSPPTINTQIDTDTPTTIEEHVDGDSTPEEPVLQTTTTNADVPVPHRKYDTGANVTAMWKDKTGMKRVWAQVTDYNYHLAKYTIYFPDNGKVKSDVAEQELQPLDSPNPPPRRNEMIGKTFLCTDCDDLPDGRWKVRSIVNVNEFRCVRLTGGGLKTVEDFDIGWVTNEYMNEQSVNRQNGIFEPVVGKRTRMSVSYF